jgi:hypothetical protein
VLFSFDCCPLGEELRVLLFRKRAAPAICEIKNGYVGYEHGGMRVSSWLKDLAQRAPEIVLAVFCFYCLRKL